MLNIESFLDKYYKDNEKIILACSSGPDSMFLLYNILNSKYKKNLVVCYFNHKLRPNSDNEESFLENLGKKEGFEVEIGSANIREIRDKLYPSISLEELAREKRYMFFSAVCQIHNTKKIITGHHLDDKIETFLFNLARGSKLSGLINMTENHGNILRPLLNIQKKDIVNYLDENNLKYFIDESNYDNDITRNHIRNEIIPKFSKINDKFKDNINNTLKYFEEVRDYIKSDVEKFLKDSDFFEIDKFKELNEFLQKEVIKEIYYKSNNNSTIGLSQANIGEIIKFINGKNNKTKKEIKNMKLFKDGNKIIIN